jgi:hypothetical protein
MSGSPPILTNALGMVSVSGLSRVPNPAANIMACLTGSSSIII